LSHESKAKRLFKQQQASLIHTSQTQFIGPLPPPEILTRYNEALPDGAERIVAMAESQLKHRQLLEQKVVESNCRAQQWGPVYGLVTCLAAIAGGIYLIHTGKDASGLAAIIAPLAGIVGVFVYGKLTQQRQLREQSSALVAPQNPRRQ
jgi:uncharacterized membrane protein